MVAPRHGWTGWWRRPIGVAGSITLPQSWSGLTPWTVTPASTRWFRLPRVSGAKGIDQQVLASRLRLASSRDPPHILGQSQTLLSTFARRRPLPEESRVDILTWI